jgi:hypothetical protein
MSGFIIATMVEDFLRSGALMFNLNSTVAAVFICVPSREAQHFSLPSLANSNRDSSRELTPPPLARQIHLTASVVIDAIIDDHGRCFRLLSMRSFAGSTSLTHLHDQPAPVQLNVTVTFKLSN